MNNKGNYKKGYRQELMKLLLSVGVISYDGLHLLEGEHRMYTRKLKEMEKEGVVRRCRVGKKWCATLTQFEEKSLGYIEHFPGYRGVYIRYGSSRSQDVGRYKSDKNRAIKAYREGEVGEIMYSAGINVLASDKPRLYNGEQIGEGAYFFSDNEIKDLQPADAKKEKGSGSVVSTRALGLLVSPGGNYVVYHTGERRIKWSGVNEYSFSYSCGRVVEEYKGQRMKAPALEQSIFFYSDSQVIVDTMDESKVGESQSITIDGISNKFKQAYVLPNNEIGRDMVRIISEEDGEDRTKVILLDGIDTKQKSKTFVSDACTDDEAILLFCLPDICKLKNFLYAASYIGNKMKFTVICFDWQEKYVAEIVGGRATVLVADYQEFIEQYRRMRGV